MNTHTSQHNLNLKPYIRTYIYIHTYIYMYVYVSTCTYIRYPHTSDTPHDTPIHQIRRITRFWLSLTPLPSPPSILILPQLLYHPPPFFFSSPSYPCGVSQRHLFWPFLAPCPSIVTVSFSLCISADTSQIRRRPGHAF